MTARPASQSHEDYRRAHAVKTSSDRAFGLVFAGVFAIVGLWPLIAGGGVRLWALGAALAFLVAALAAPRMLAPFNRLWTGFGLLLHRVVNPLVMGILFFTTVTPMGLAMRLAGKDPLRLKREPEAKSYWIERQPPGPAPETMTRQF